MAFKSGGSPGWVCSSFCGSLQTLLQFGFVWEYLRGTGEVLLCILFSSWTSRLTWKILLKKQVNRKTVCQGLELTHPSLDCRLIRKM